MPRGTWELACGNVCLGKGTSSLQQGVMSSSRFAQLASLPRILGTALRRLQESHDGALVSPGRWGRVTSLGTREQAGVEQPLGSSGLGGSRKLLCTDNSCCSCMRFCVCEGWVLLLLLTCNTTFLKSSAICSIMRCSV